MRPRRRKRRITARFFLFLFIILGVGALVTVAILAFGNGGANPSPTSPVASQSGKPSQGATTSGSPNQSETASPSPTPTSVLPADFVIAPVDATDPAKQGFITGIYKGDSEKALTSYTRETPINFSVAENYTTLPGITTFRGNNFRNMSSYGTAEVKQEVLTKVWMKKTGSVAKSKQAAPNGGSWTGSCWTGQPLIVKWPEDIKKVMNLYDDKKADKDLVEVIYPCVDGYIHFYDLKDGSETRKPIKTGVPHKGTATLYPDGTPIIFIGQGDKTATYPEGATMKFRVYSLITGKMIYSFGSKDPIKPRGWEAYDSSPMISADTDTLIEPGENGVLYTIKLNTKFDKAAGTVSVNPDEPIKFTYTSPKYDEKKRWWGWESSCSIWRNYFFSGDNGGTMTCIDLNTMKLVWAADVTDDTNTSPVLEESKEDGTAYIYSANSIETKNNPDGICNIRKIDIKTGKSVWTTPYKCYTTSATEGGMEATPILGKNDIEGLIIYPLGRYPTKNTGTLVALDTKTGKQKWSRKLDNYVWSSPVTFYTPEGKSYIVVCDVTGGSKTAGNIYLLEGKTGDIIHTYTFADYNSAEYDAEKNRGAAIEATPAVYDDMLVIGTRGQRVYCFKIK
jgi:outer membrane protein assembly factor BamB